MKHKNKKSFKIFPVIIFAVLISTLLTVGFFHNETQAQTTATLALSPTLQSIGLNQTFTVTINLNTAGAPVDGVDIYSLRFNPSILQVVDSDTVTSGVQISASTLLPLTAVNTVNNTAGTIQFSQSTAGGTNFTGSGIIATITFRGIGGGTSAVTFDFTPGITSDTNVAYQGNDRLGSVTNASYTVDTQAPSTPSNLSASVVSASQINLAWTASTDNIGVTGYQLERCTGATCTNFTQIATPTTTSFNNTGLSSGTTYRYRVRASDGAGNLSTYSTIVNGTTQSNFDFSLSNGGARSVNQGASVTNTITATLTAGSTQTTSFGASGLPSGVSATFSPTTCSPTCSTTLTLTASGSATIGTSSITVTGSASGVNRTSSFNLTVNSANYQRTISIASLEGLTNNVVTGTLNTYNTSRTLLRTYSFTTNTSGNATITFDVPLQTAYLQIRTTPFLSRQILQDLNSTGTYSFPQLLTGDINQDNIINSVDYSILNTNWFTSNASADLNRDGLVNSIDYSFMNRHWLATGEQ